MTPDTIEATFVRQKAKKRTEIPIVKTESTDSAIESYGVYNLIFLGFLTIHLMLTPLW